MDKHLIRENLLKKICKTLGWNINELTQKQRLIIIKKIKEY
jgi:hypothetical protein